MIVMPDTGVNVNAVTAPVQLISNSWPGLTVAGKGTVSVAKVVVCSNEMI